MKRLSVKEDIESRWTDWATFMDQETGKGCRHCEGFYSKYRCNKPDECDCPKCQGYCECKPREVCKWLERL